MTFVPEIFASWISVMSSSYPIPEGHHIGAFELFLECEPRLRGHRGCVFVEIRQRDKIPHRDRHHPAPLSITSSPSSTFAIIRCTAISSTCFHRFIDKLDFAKVFIRERDREHPLFGLDRTLRGIEGCHRWIGTRCALFFTECVLVVFQDGGAVVLFCLFQHSGW